MSVGVATDQKQNKQTARR